MPWVDPNASYYSQVQQNLAPTPQTGFSSTGPSSLFTSPETVSPSVTGAIQAQNAPALANQGLQASLISKQLGQLGPDLQQAGDYATAMAGYQLGGQDINRQQVGLQQQGTEQNYNISQQQRNLQQQGTEQNYGIGQQQFGLQQQGMDQSYGIQQQQYGLQQQGIQQQQAQQALSFQNQMQGIIGGNAASGALNTQGSKQQQSTAQQENVFAGQTLGRSQQQLGLNEQQSAGDYSRAQQGLGLNEQAAAGQFSRTEQGYGLQNQLSAGDYARAQQNYGLIGQANGLAQQEVQTRLQSGLQQLGESSGATADSLVAQMGGVLSGESTGVGSTLSQAGLLGGLNPLSGLG